MPDANELVTAMKKAALDAMESAKPVSVYFGEVISASPLKINVEQKMELGKAQLILSRNVTDFKTSISDGNINVTVHNALVAGEQVILLRQQGGQKFIVWDRIG